MYSLNDITNSCGTIETLGNGQRNQKISTCEIPVVKVEISEPFCNTVRHQTISLPQESIYDVRSLGEINTEEDVLKIQISNVHGATSDKNNDKKGNQVKNISKQQMRSTFHIGTQEKSPLAERFPGKQLFTSIQAKRYPLETEVQSPVNQSNNLNGKPLSDAEPQKELPFQINSTESEIVAPYNLIHQPDVSQMSRQYPSPAYQNVTMSAYQVETRGTLLSYQNGTPEIVSSHQISSNIAAPSAHMTTHASVPLYHMEETPTSQIGNSTNAPPSVHVNSQATVPLHHMEETSFSQTGDREKNASVKADYHAGMSKYYGDFSFHDLQQGMPFWKSEIYDMVPNLQRSAHSCNCCCHGRNESPRHPDLDPKSERPSVIMVPVSWNSSDSGKSHLPLKVDTTAYKLHSGEHWPNKEGVVDGVHYLGDSDSSDDDDEYGKEKYFRKEIDGTTARFKLTKEDWARIPINTFPSGGRLLSGDWTRIFLSKVKESNPWCSLRFKNNHVRSENSRKIHSAVFFRGGAECKRPECNVKVRFVIRKEKGKHVDVTYVGNVCHDSQPGGSDATSTKKRLIHVRRTYSN